MLIAYRLTCPEPYFISEGLYAALEELENAREITLHVMTIGSFIEDATKVNAPSCIKILEQIVLLFILFSRTNDMKIFLNDKSINYKSIKQNFLLRKFT